MVGTSCVAEVEKRGFGGPGMAPSLVKVRASYGAIRPQPIVLSRMERVGRRAVARIRYFQSAGVSSGWAAATSAATPPTYPVAYEVDGLSPENTQSPAPMKVVSTFMPGAATSTCGPWITASDGAPAASTPVTANAPE